MSAVDVTISPPPPRPCTARQTISHTMLSANPAQNEPTPNTTTDSWNISLRPNRSPSLPTTTVMIVSASRYDVTTQDRCPAPPRSPTMVGSAVPTMVWSSAASSIPSSTAPKTALTRPRLRAGGTAAPGVTSAVAVISPS